MIFDDLPNLLCINTEIFMRSDVAETFNSNPGDVTFFL